MDYIVGEKPPPGACIFCDKPGANADRENLILRTDADCVVLLNRYPYSNGHLMVAPRAHTADLKALDGRVYGRLMEELRGAAGIVQKALAPHGLNIGLNLGKAAGAGIDTHLHWHIVPRWEGDTNFMPVVADTKVMPQHLLASYDQLVPYFA